MFKILNLPLEIRMEISLLATQPRIVFVKRRKQGDEDPEEFWERLNGDTEIELHPDVEYLKPLWQLFVGKKHQDAELRSTVPGSASIDAPYGPKQDIPLSWLRSHLSMAQDLVGISSLYSAATIPPLLHAWSESRATLMAGGYQLVFSTRTHGPQTWFNFERDTLFLPSDTLARYVFPRDCLSNTLIWNISQFRSEDLRRVQNLALGDSGYCYTPESSHMEEHQPVMAELINVLRFFENIKELMAVEWTEPRLGDSCGCDTIRARPGTEVERLEKNRPQGSVRNGKTHMFSVPALVSDVLIHVSSPLPDVRTEVATAGTAVALLAKRFKTRTVEAEEYFRMAERDFAQAVAKNLETLLGSADRKPPTPRVVIAHLLSLPAARLLFEERKRAVEGQSEMCDEFRATLLEKGSPSRADWDDPIRMLERVYQMSGSGWCDHNPGDTYNFVNGSL